LQPHGARRRGQELDGSKNLVDRQLF
jgi:hypothetical protein